MKKLTIILTFYGLGEGGVIFSFYISFNLVYISFHSEFQSSTLPGTTGFWWGCDSCDCDCDCDSCDGAKTKSTPSLLDLARIGVWQKD